MAKSFELPPQIDCSLGCRATPLTSGNDPGSQSFLPIVLCYASILDFCVLIYCGNRRRRSVFQLSETWLDLPVRSWVAFRFSKGGRPPTTREGGGGGPAGAWRQPEAFFEPRIKRTFSPSILHGQILFC